MVSAVVRSQAGASLVPRSRDLLIHEATVMMRLRSSSGEVSYRLAVQSLIPRGVVNLAGPSIHPALLTRSQI